MSLLTFQRKLKTFYFDLVCTDFTYECTRTPHDFVNYSYNVQNATCYYNQCICYNHNNYQTHHSIYNIVGGPRKWRGPKG